MRSGDQDLPVSLLIPDAVLTGQRYDVDVVFDEPLDGAVAAEAELMCTLRDVEPPQRPASSPASAV